MERLFALLLLVASLNVGAVPIMLSGTVQGTNPITSSTVDEISSSWSLTYDDGSVNPVGLTRILPTLLTFTLDPDPLGTTSFDTSNVGASVRYIDGVLTQISLWGKTGTSNEPLIFIDKDDFGLVYDVLAMSWKAANWSLASEPSLIVGSQQLTGSVSGIPGMSVAEPGTLALLGLGLALAGLGHKRRHQPR